MLAVGIGAVAVVIVKALLVITVVLGGAYALTTYVELPGLVDTLIWLAAGGYSLLNLISLVTVLGTLYAAAGSVSTRRFR